jgi:hypothetical protein
MRMQLGKHPEKFIFYSIFYFLFVILGNKKIYFIFKIFCIVSVSFYKIRIIFVTLHFYVQIILVSFTNHALKFKYPSQQDAGYKYW